MRIAFIFGLSLICLGLYLAAKDYVQAEYNRGFIEGRKSANNNYDDICIKWWLETDLISAKKRICKR